MTRYGYARVSTDKQDQDLQKNALIKDGVLPGDIYEDVVSGKTTSRDGLNRVLSLLKAGDTLVVWKLDRLGRDTIHLMTLVKDLVERGIGFKSLMESWDTSTPMGRAMFSIGCVFAELERETIRMRVKAGIAAKMAAGRPTWGKRPRTPYKREDVVAMARAGHGVTEIARRAGISVSTVRRTLDRPREA